LEVEEVGSVPLFTINVDLKYASTMLRRIAEALERIAPLPDDLPAELKPEDAVSYVDEQKLAEQELAREAGAWREYMAAHPEEFEEEAEGDAPHNT